MRLQITVQDMENNMGKFKVVEMFSSINGEGQKAGQLAYFVRFAGCNLRCSYCDTMWANEKNVPFLLMSEEEIYEKIKESNIHNITLTGGEPLLQQNIDRLLKLLSRDESLNIEIETNGSIDIKELKKISDKISFTLDYKLPGSGMDSFMNMDNYAVIGKNDTVKFVVSDKNDLDKTKQIIEKYKLTDKTAVYISSSFNSIKPEQIVEYMLKENMNGVRLQLQMHKYIWEPDRKGV